MQDLTAPQWTNDPQARVVIEARDDIKLRLGGRSPDFGEALAHTFYPNGAAKMEGRAFSGEGLI